MIFEINFDILWTFYETFYEIWHYGRLNIGHKTALDYYSSYWNILVEINTRRNWCYKIKFIWKFKLSNFRFVVKIKKYYEVKELIYKK